jgi:cytochrome c oxidase assembly protein subunit 15
MKVESLVQLAVTGLMVANVVLVSVWMSADVNKYRKLVWSVAFLTFDLIVFGAFTRLTDSGLGCPDWPGCYGAANPFLAHADISAAQTLLPSGPVTAAKAWIEMIHRYLAMGIGLLIGGLMLKAWFEWRRTKRAAFHPFMPVVLFLLVAVQGAFGALTVTMKLQPVIVTIHLILGMTLLAGVAWMGARQDSFVLTPPSTALLHPARGLRVWALVSAAVLALQIALGGWVSTNYATLACTDFPLCGGQLVPDMDFEHGFTLWRALGKTAAGHYLPFSALTAIHWVHRNFAFVVLAVLGATAWRAARHADLRRIAIGMGAVLALQAASGIATVFLSFPLAIAVLHNAGAALLVLLVTMLNYKTKYRFSAQAQARPHS